MVRIIEAAQLNPEALQGKLDADRMQERLRTGRRVADGNRPADSLSMGLDRADISSAARAMLSAERSGLSSAGLDQLHSPLLDRSALVYHPAQAQIMSAQTPASANQASLDSTTAPANNPPPPDVETMNAIAGSIAMAIFGALAGSPLQQQVQQIGQDDTATADETVAAPPPPPSSASLGNYNINNITTKQDGGLQGELNLSEFALGTQMVELQRGADGAIVGASAQQQGLGMQLGGGAMRLEGADGEAFFRIDQNGALNFSGQASMEVAGQQIVLGQAEATVSYDDAGERLYSIEGTSRLNGGEFSVTVSANGGFSASVSTDMVGSLVPGFDKVTGFLDRVGGDLDAGGGEASISYDPDQQAFAFDFNGLRGAYNNTTGDFSFGGLSIGAGVSLSLDDVTINTRTGAVSAEVSGGVGVGVSGFELGVDLAGASFAYDPDNQRITLSKTDGIAAANIETTVTLDRDGNTGLYLPSSVSFQANYDDALARDVAAGLNQAYAVGMQLGNQAVNELNRVSAYGNAQVRDFAQGLAAAGNDTANYLNRVTSFGGERLSNFLAAGADAGNQLDALINRSGSLAGNNLDRFLSNAASGGRDFISGFESTMGVLSKIGGSYTNLGIDASGGINAMVNVGNLGRMNLSFERQGNDLIGSGAFSLGGASFNNAQVTFNDQGALTGVSGNTSLRTPGLRWHGIGIGSQTLDFSLGMDSRGNIQATASASINLGWLGRHGLSFTLGTGGISGRVS